MKFSNSIKTIFIILIVAALLLQGRPAAVSASSTLVTIPEPTIIEFINALVDSGSSSLISTGSSSYIEQIDPGTTAVFTNYADNKSHYYPTSGTSWVGLSNGVAADMVKGLSNSPGSIDTFYNDCYASDTCSDVNDVTKIKIHFNIPDEAESTKNCLSFDVQEFSKEWPQYAYDGSEYNDTFIAELDTNDWSVSGTTITAPNNFALAPGDKIFSINSGLDWKTKYAIGTPFQYKDGEDDFHGGSGRYTISKPIAASGEHDLYLSIFDMGDDQWDTAVFLDNLRFFHNDGTCTTGVNPFSFTDVNPVKGSLSGGQKLTITGTGFTSGTTTVVLDGITLACTFVSSEEMSCITPPHAAGPVSITVTTPDGTAALDGIFTYANAPAPGSGSTKTAALPSTGFAPSVVTNLPQQPAEKAYSKMSGLWLEIPSQKVLTQIVGVPEVDGNWDVTWLGKDAGWLNGTAFPTWTGNSVVTAHVTDANGKAGPFAGLSNLNYGEKIVVHLYGGKYTFEVRESRLVFPSMVSYALGHLDDHSYLTLITCQGYNFLTNNYIFRHVVRAVLISVTPE